MQPIGVFFLHKKKLDPLTYSLYSHTHYIKQTCLLIKCEWISNFHEIVPLKFYFSENFAHFFRFDIFFPPISLIELSFWYSFLKFEGGGGVANVIHHSFELLLMETKYRISRIFTETQI